MDSNTSAEREFLMNPSNFGSIYHQTTDHNAIIDLGLSLRTLQSEAYDSPTHFMSSTEYGDLMNWSQFSPYLRSSNVGYYPPLARRDCDDEETEAVQSKERWNYVKVNMEGVIVGRKICVLDHAGYSSLALQLEDMFGKHSDSGLRLFQAGSEFCLFYKDGNENWRAAGDLPWKEFVDCVIRLRIARKNEAQLHSESAFT